MRGRVQNRASKGKSNRHRFANSKFFFLKKIQFYLKGKFPLKSNGDIKDLVSQKNNGFLIEEEWKEIIFYMYEQEDANYLYSKMVEHIKRKYNDNKTIDNNK